MAVDIIQNDVLEYLSQLPDEYATAILCDPPYGLAFMGKEWDHGVPSVAVWAEALRVCKPGAVLLAFGGTRTFHRLAVAIEDAGFEIADTMMWLYGSGFPKSHNISKAIDKAAGAEREVVGIPVYGDGHVQNNGTPRNKSGRYNFSMRDGIDPNPTITAPATPTAETWDGYGTALKPAWEPVIVARKPRRGTYAQTAVEHGTGALWVDGCRIGTDVETWPKTRRNGSGNGRTCARGSGEPYTALTGKAPSGRWPANLALVHHEECERVGVRRVKGNGAFPKDLSGSSMFGLDGHSNGERREMTDADGLETVDDWNCHPDCPVRMLGEQSGELQADRHRAGYYNNNNTAIWGNAGAAPFTGRPDSPGTAARFFYQAKASRAEREAGLEGMERHFLATMNNGIGAREHNESQPSAWTRNHHPTVKPLAVAEYLARLILPPAKYRDDAVLLVPFAGSGSEMIGAWQAGWRNVVGIELEPEYCEIAKARIAHWCAQGVLF